MENGVKITGYATCSTISGNWLRQGLGGGPANGLHAECNYTTTVPYHTIFISVQHLQMYLRT